MNFNVYLPDEIGQRAKDEGLKLSRLLRDAVDAEFRRREAVKNVAYRRDGEPQIYEFDWEREGGGTFTARVTGWRLWPDHDDDVLQLFATTDDRLLAVYPDQQTSVRLDEPGENLVNNLLNSGFLADDAEEVFRAFGLKPVVEL
jgi:hypothetical protein